MDPAIITDRFLEELRTNNAVFSAFKTHRMQNDIARQLIDPETGRLKSFERWRLDIKGMTDHYCLQWLQTEYDTAVIRAHQAADWKHFLEEADVLPNIRWMQTTSLTPDPLHEMYWRKKLTLPVNHPFWNEHRPGDRWNCKCSLMQTDEPVNAEALEGWTPPLPMPGLDNNPAKDGKIFSDTHPYFTEAYPGAKKAAHNFLKDDYLPFKANSVEEARQFILDHIAESVDFNIQKARLDELSYFLNLIRDRMEFYRLPKFKSFERIAGRKALAGISRNGKTFYLSPGLLDEKTIDRYYDELLRFKEKYKYRELAVESKEDLRRYIIDHELGHKIAIEYYLSPGEVSRALSKDIRVISDLSYYASTNPDEYWAECVAAYHGPLRKKMNEIELNLVEKFFKENNFSVL